jgi:hypothetical protein
MNAHLTISPNFIEIGRLLFFGPFGIAAPTIADYVHSRMLDFNTCEDPKFKRILELARRLPPTYGSAAHDIV